MLMLMFCAVHEKFLLDALGCGPSLAAATAMELHFIYVHDHVCSSTTSLVKLLRVNAAQLMTRCRPIYKLAYESVPAALCTGTHKASWRLALGGEARPSKVMPSAEPPAHEAPSLTGPEISASGGWGLSGACMHE